MLLWGFLSSKIGQEKKKREDRELGKDGRKIPRNGKTERKTFKDIQGEKFIFETICH